MNHLMNNNDVTSRLLRRYAVAQNPIGRFLLRVHLWQQRFRAGWLADGADIIKRTVDIAASLVLLALISPLILLIAILIKIEDGGPVFFAQTRVGQFGREFKMYKIRSMCLDAEQRLKELLEKNRHKEGRTILASHALANGFESFLSTSCLNFTTC